MRYWPEYLPKKGETILTPAVLLTSAQVITDGELKWKVNSWDDIYKIVVSQQMVLFVESLTNHSVFPYIKDMIEHPKVEVHRTTQFVKVSVKYGRRKYWIVPVTYWNWTFANEHFLEHINKIFDHCLGYIKPTPSQLGKRLMLHVWQENKRSPTKHQIPSKPCRMIIKDELVGGRIEPIPGQVLMPGHWKMDQDNALVSHFALHPTGTAIRRIGNIEPKNETYFCKVHVKINDQLKLGPFPVRNPWLHWPTEPGIYETWLWKEQLEDALNTGKCDVMFIEGWSWPYLTKDHEAWSRLMITLRNTAPDDEMKKTIKKIASSSISCMGIGDADYYYVPQWEYEPSRGDQRLYDSKGPLNIVARTDRNSKNPTPVHWYAYTWMQVSRTIYRMALPYAMENNLVQMHTDALWIKVMPKLKVGWKLCQVS